MSVLDLDLSPDACAIIEIAVREYWVSAERDVETARCCESPGRQAEEDSETYQAGRRMTTAANLVTLLTAASGISVKVVVP